MAWVIFFIVGIAALLGAIIYFGWLYEKKRTQKLEEIAARMGLSFSPTDNQNMQARFSAFALFNQGRSRKISNVLSGETDEVSITIFDYQYTTGSGKNSKTFKLSVASLESTQLANLPYFSMRPENLFDRLGAILGFQDIDFQEHPAFSRSFVLKGSDEAAIRACFRPAVLDFFAARPGVSVEAKSGHLIYFRSGSRAKAEEYPKLLEEAYQVFGAFVD